MNILVTNKHSMELTNLNIDTIQAINGEFSIDDLVNQFSNFVFNKMIIDITAIKDYQNINTIQQLSTKFDMSRVILLLDDSITSDIYLSELVAFGIYNFTKDINQINYLIEHTNSYDEVKQYHKQDIVTSNNVENRENVNNSPVTNTVSEGLKILGVKNVTPHAGATTLVYMLKKQLEAYYKVVAVEVDNKDFLYLNDPTLKNTTSLDLPAFIATNRDVEVILVDLNDKASTNSCTDVIYLIEPGLIKLNKLIGKDKNAFERIKNNKLVLNKSVLTDADKYDFEYESKTKIFYNIPYLDDKKSYHPELDEFLANLGFSKIKQGEKKKKGSFFDLFKKS
ncbi:MAG: hypothetical protein IJ574_05815 [Bacilli bacterium]|nr:hypothetical protein [Bacilli bacterium]